MSTPKCSAITDKGQACRFAPQFDGLCLAHAGRAGNLDAKEVLRLRGVNGYKRAKESAEAKKLQSCSLRSTSDQLAVLERQVVKVENSGASATEKANAIVRLVGEARATLKANELERENAELWALVTEKYPDVARRLNRRLKVVQ